MTESANRRGIRLRAHVISPLAIGLLAGAAQAHAGAPPTPAADTAKQPALSDPLLDFSHRIKPVGGPVVRATAAPRLVANAMPACLINDDAFVTQAQVAVSDNVRSNDSVKDESGADVVAHRARVVSYTQGAIGAVTMDTSNDQITNGAFTYTPAAGASGVDTFTYTVQQYPSRCGVYDAISDGEATVTVTVNPVATNDSYTITGSGQLVGNVLADDIGSGLVVSSFSQPAHGSVNVSPSGDVVYVPQNGYSGPDSFNYTVTDSTGNTSSAAVTLVVAAPPPPPTPVPAAGAGGLGLLATLLTWLGLRRRREDI